MLSEHARRRLCAYYNVVGDARMERFMRRVTSSMRPHGDFAVVHTLFRPIEDPTGRNWYKCNRLVAIIRDGCVTTIMLSRDSQINTHHLNVTTII